MYRCTSLFQHLLPKDLRNALKEQNDFSQELSGWSLSPLIFHWRLREAEAEEVFYQARGKFRTESEQSSLCAVTSVSVAIHKKQVLVFRALNQTGIQRAYS